MQINKDKPYIKWKYFTDLYEIDSMHPADARVCHKLSRRHIQLDNTAKMRVKFATQVSTFIVAIYMLFSMFSVSKVSNHHYFLKIFSISVAIGLGIYKKYKFWQFEGCEETIEFCLKMNNIFDALNRKQCNEGLTPESKDYKVCRTFIFILLYAL